MADPLKPKRPALGLEVWASGTWEEIALLRSQLALLGVMVVPYDNRGRPDSSNTPTPMAGADAGRYRWYGRVHVRRV